MLSFPAPGGQPGRRDDRRTGAVRVSAVAVGQRRPGRRPGGHPARVRGEERTRHHAQRMLLLGWVGKGIPVPVTNAATNALGAILRRIAPDVVFLFYDFTENAVKCHLCTTQLANHGFFSQF